MEIAVRWKTARTPFALFSLLIFLTVTTGGCAKGKAPQEEAAAAANEQKEMPEHPPKLECLLSPPRLATLGKAVELTFVLRNTGPAPVWVLRWQTPLEDLRGDVLQIVGPDGKPLAYQGPMVKRGDPTPEEYVRLESGAAAERVVDIAAAYPFAAPGTYSVTFNLGLADVAGREGDVPRRRDLLRPFPLSCGPVDFPVAAAK
ncbi:MAG: protease [Acidobacteriota bacterium]